MSLLRDWQRQRLKAQPFPEPWRSLLRTHFPHYARLNPTDQRELEGHVQVFLAEKTFEGCGGLALTDTIRVLIAAQACLLLLHRETDYYPTLRTILVYPSHYFAVDRHHEPGGVLTEEVSTRLGESWSHGAVVLAWSAVTAGVEEVADGHNVVFHEFAHQLDLEDGSTDGVPVLAPHEPAPVRQSRYAAWARILSAEYADLRAGHDSVLDDYGATNPAEFFAVATEAFFEKPHALRQRHPALYEELRRFYRQDPGA